MLAIALLVTGIIARLIIHLPNFTPVVALALFGGVYLKKKHAILLPLALFFITDIFLGLHQLVLFTWGSIIMIAFLGIWLKAHKSPKVIFISSLFSAILFFVTTNFGVWLISGLYPHTVEGFINCYVLAIPFFRNTLLSTFVYCFAFFGFYEFIAYRVKGTKLARVLLTT
ncbi:MAG: DUF6580 family putative transport protein [Candidatus Omnitrophota bacterium]